MHKSKLIETNVIFFTLQIMESQLNFIAENEPWKNLSSKYFGIQSYLKEAISKSIMFDIQPHLLLDDDKIDDVVQFLLNHHQTDLLEAMIKVIILYQAHIKSNVDF